MMQANMALCVYFVWPAAMSQISSSKAAGRTDTKARSVLPRGEVATESRDGRSRWLFRSMRRGAPTVNSALESPPSAEPGMLMLGTGSGAKRAAAGRTSPGASAAANASGAVGASWAGGDA